MNGITVILNCYKRPEYLKEQIESIKSQSVKPDDIWIWYNKPENETQYDITGLGCKVVTCNHNFKFHGRFAFGLLAQTNYVAFFDDDTIPGNRWFENCLLQMESGDYILGTTGVLLQGDGYDPHSKIGWNGMHNNELELVDLVGHAWFLKRDTLKFLWQQYPISWENGEDIQLSAFSYMFGNIPTAVPPHPDNDVSLWGSVSGIKYGNDTKASHWKTNHSSLRNDICKKLSETGYKRVLIR